MFEKQMLIVSNSLSAMLVPFSRDVCLSFLTVDPFSQSYFEIHHFFHRLAS